MRFDSPLRTSNCQIALYKMSFYQPSLSLYDVMNALSDQAELRNPSNPVSQLQRRRAQAQMEAQAQAQAQAEAQARIEALAARRQPFHGGASGAPTYYYGLPGGSNYYRPGYYYSGEDEEDLAGEEGDPVTESAYVNPSYYHSRSPKGGRANKNVDLSELMNALLGAPPAGYVGGQEEEKEEGNEEKEQGDEGANDEKEKDSEENGNERQETLEKDSEPETIKSSAAQLKAPFPFTKRQSFVHQQARSPVPDPLQVSKPETRLDLPFSPEVNVYDCPNYYVVAVALPGATSKAFKVDYHPSSHELIIRGDLEDKLNLEEKYLKVTELKYGAFQRTLKFPVLPRIKDEDIKATYNNGLLQVKVPKIAGSTEKPAPKKRIVIEDVPDEELEFEENPNPVQ